MYVTGECLSVIEQTNSTVIDETRLEKSLRIFYSNTTWTYFIKANT